MKICPCCKIEKEDSEFYKNRRRKDGLTVYCKTCTAEKSKEYHATHKDECKARLQKWRAANREYVRERDKKYRLSRPEQERAKERRYRETHPEKIREKNKKYREANPEYFKAKHQERRAVLKARDDGTVTKEKLDTLYDTQHGLCAYCKCNLKISGVCIDHTIPISRGGLHTITNIKLVCPTCNLSKGTKLEDEWTDRYSKEE